MVVVVVGRVVEVAAMEVVVVGAVLLVVMDVVVVDAVEPLVKVVVVVPATVVDVVVCGATVVVKAVVEEAAAEVVVAVVGDVAGACGRGRGAVAVKVVDPCLLELVTDVVIVDMVVVREVVTIALEVVVVDVEASAMANCSSSFSENVSGVNPTSSSDSCVSGGLLFGSGNTNSAFTIGLPCSIRHLIFCGRMPVLFLSASIRALRFPAAHGSDSELLISTFTFC